jgi:hypothetical protein
MNKILALILIISFNTTLNAQDDLLNEIEGESQEDYFEMPAFKALHIVNLQSTKTAAKGDFYFNVTHRFGNVSDGLETFFGLDNANTRIETLFGITDKIQVGLSRESAKKLFSGHAKISIINQSNKSPINLVIFTSMNVDTELDSETYPTLENSDRLSYANLLLISRRLSNKFSIELSPGYIRHNLTVEENEKHDQFVIGTGGRYKITKRISINLDYAYNLSRDSKSLYNNPLAIGMDLETGGHVFQLLFSNTQFINETSYLSYGEGDWLNGDFYFGFNLVRVF